MSVLSEKGLIVTTKEEDISELVEILKTMNGVRCNVRYDPFLEKNVNEITMDFLEVRHKFTIVTTKGHLTVHDFRKQFHSWMSCDPKELLSEKLVIVNSAQHSKVIEFIQRESRKSSTLILWMYGGIEDEYIAQQAIDIVRQVNPQIESHRLHIPSVLTTESVLEAFEDSQELSASSNNAFNTLQSICFQGGTILSRLLTKQMKLKFETKHLLIYGPGQAKILDHMVTKYRSNAARKSTTEAEIQTLISEMGLIHSEFSDEFKPLLLRDYVRNVKGNEMFVPTKLGMALIDFLNSVAPEIVGQQFLDQLNQLAEDLRAKRRTKAFITKSMTDFFTQIYQKIEDNIEQLKIFLTEAGLKIRENQDLMRCPMCRKNTMGMWRKKDGGEAFLGCSAYPKCEGHFWFSGTVKTVGPSTKSCHCIGGKCVTLTFCDNTKRVGCLVCDRSIQDAIKMERMKYTWLLDDDLVPAPSIQPASNLMPPPRPAVPPPRPATPPPSRPSTPPQPAKQPVRTPLAQIQLPQIQLILLSTSGQKQKADQPGPSSRKKFCPDPDAQKRCVRPRAAAAKIVSQDENAVFNPDGVICRCNKLASMELNTEYELRMNEFFYRCARDDRSNCGFFEWVSDRQKAVEQFSEDSSDLF